ncbi:hypothetical protein N7457_003071 [Penicillium paradoxum]|uniref:uncharacterized protein n=1 Tax=Penicillium paradoxum TaxID=176176 RepID=UPI002546AA12|nr:uncharacterized protein N7457_003071 [Penicillium paradoxum]KAJ5788081.1 hypothetical protein N7457_003071 [Penicillium paradoxum]
MDTSERENSPGAGDLNDLFDYDVGLDEIIPDTNTNTNNKASGTGDSALGLGLDEEVKVTKKRQPVAKLDESRLLSKLGIPKLRYTATQKLRFKGKGHEFQDAARLLNFYQLWLDDLFPRAKFADGLTMIEKLGHSKRIQVMRREWIDEEKPRLVEELNKLGEERIKNPGSNHPTDSSNQPVDCKSIADQDLFISDPSESARPIISFPELEDDDLDDLLREQDEPMTNFRAEMPVSVSRVPNGDDDYDAEYEAMKELGM